MNQVQEQGPNEKVFKAVKVLLLIGALAIYSSSIGTRPNQSIRHQLICSRAWYYPFDRHTKPNQNEPSRSLRPGGTAVLQGFSGHLLQLETAPRAANAWFWLSLRQVKPVIEFSLAQIWIVNSGTLPFAGRKTPSVAAIVQPGNTGGFQKVFFGKEEIAIPTFGSTAEAVEAHPKADIFINFASYRR